MACEAECRAFLTIQAESRPGSWPVVVCERSENKGSGGGSG